MGACLACAACQGVCTSISLCFSCVGCCCGGGETPRDLGMGKIRALALMISSLVLALASQYWLYEYLDGLDAWTEGCDDEAYSEDFRETCIGNTAVYRVSFVDAAFFLLMTLGALTSTLFNNRYWGLKLLLWIVLIIGSIFISNDVFDTTGYVWVARIGAFIFTILQQIVLIDLAYRWNDAWVIKAQELGEDSEGRSYLVSLLTISVFVIGASLVAIGFMFHYFSGCAVNELVISLTLILSVVVTLAQLSGEHGNLLASSLVVGYATFLCFSAVSKTPESECNPFLGEENITTVLVGLAFTVISLCWVCLSASSSITALLGGSDVQIEDNPRPSDSSRSKPFIQTPVEEGSGAATAAPAGAMEYPEAEPDDGGQGWRFNVVLVLIAMYFGMMLTNWGDINSSGESGDPSNGWVAMWLTVSGQWICLLIYLWTIIAPRLFPDRDFS